MSFLGWSALGLALAVVLDLLVVWVWRLKRHGRLPKVPSIDRRIPRFLPLPLIVSGAIALFLGQSLETPFPATGAQASIYLGILGVGLVALGGLTMRWSLLAAKPGKGKRKIGKKRTATTAPPRPLPDIPNLELVAILLGAAITLFVGRMMSSFLPQNELFWSHIFTGLGMGFFILVALGFSERRLPSPISRALQAASKWLGVTPAQVVLLVLAPLVGLATWLAAGDAALMRQPVLAIFCWILGTALVVVGSAVSIPRLPARLHFSWEVIGLGALFLVALLLRGLATEQAPYPFTGDEGSAGLIAIQFIDGLRDNVFGVAWASLPSLFFYVQSLFIRVFGRDAEALRVVSALAGALTVPMTYAFAKEVFGKRMAWISAAYLAVFHFHIHFSRIGLQLVWDAFFMVLFATLTWRAWKHNQRMAFVGAGLALGLSQYFYASIRVALPLIMLWLIVAGIQDWGKLRRRLPGFGTMLLATIVIALPLTLFFVKHPDEFQAPFRRVGALGSWLENEAQFTGLSVWEVLWGQFKNATLGFTSVNLRLVYEPDRPMLLALPATLFLMGASLLLVRIRELRSVWLILWFLGAIAVGTLSLSPPPSQRYVFVAPAVAILIALPLVTASDWLAELWPNWRRALTGLAVLLFVVTAWIDLSFYFGEYTTRTSVRDGNTETAQALADILVKEDEDTYVYFLGGRMGFRTHSNVPYLAPHIEGTDIIQRLSSAPELGELGHTYFILLPERQDELGILQVAYPGGRTFERLGVGANLLFIGYEIQGS